MGPGYTIAKTIERMIKSEQCDEAIWTAIGDLIYSKGTGLMSARRYFEKIIDEIKERREHWSQWLPPSLVASKPKALLQRTLPSTPPAVTEQDSKLMSLPPEIRKIIFEHALVQPGNLRQKNFATGRLVPREAAEPALTRTCRQIRSEAIPIFYQANTFIFHVDRLKALEEAQEWIRATGDYKVSFMHSVVLHGFELDAVNMHLSLRSARYGVDLRNFTAKCASERPKSSKGAERVDEWLEALEQSLGGYALSSWDLLDLLVVFVGALSDTESGKVKMLHDA